MREEAVSESKEGKRMAARENHERSVEMGVDEGRHVGFETGTRLRDMETKEQGMGIQVK
jgi:hypothetical protein